MTCQLTDLLAEKSQISGPFTLPDLTEMKTKVLQGEYTLHMGTQ